MLHVHKKKSKSDNDNYRPLNILSNISKVYERYIYDQIQSFFDKILFKYRCEFRKGYNPQQCLIALMEKRVNNGGAFGALLTDLSKAFVMLCAIWCYLHILNNVKNTHRRVTL